MYEEFEAWLDRFLEKGLPENIVAVNFNLYECDEETEFDVQLIGSSEYDEDDPDWACSDEFSTGEDVLAVTADGWEKCQSKCAALVRRYLRGGKYAEALNDLAAVTVGFVDGDLEVVE